ncbi:MAG TPA: HNH endonuclease signature motif containing protein [Gemmataceae bacterium]|nr:HNH endonuclease signature motif containing protein [Gemmataceae bacterium]
MRGRAHGRCEYCLIHEEDSVLGHVPDHIMACHHGGQTRAENLAWSCYLCNHLKGSDVASVDLETGRVVRLFNPRKDRWSRHFRLAGARIVPLTAVGRVTEYLLQFNDTWNVEARQALIENGRYPG